MHLPHPGENRKGPTVTRQTRDPTETLTIGKLAAAAGVKRSTVRYYELENLLGPAGWSAHGYRQYDAASLERLAFIRAAQSAGFSLEDVRALLRLRDRPAAPCDRVRGLIDGRLENVERQLDDLRRVRDVLRDACRECLRGEPREVCAVLEDLSHKGPLNAPPDGL